MSNHTLLPGQPERLQEFRSVNDVMVKLNWQHASQMTWKKIYEKYVLPFLLSYLDKYFGEGGS